MTLAVLILLSIIAILTFSYFTTPGGLNEVMDKWLKQTLWIWLPFFALITLTKELIHRSQSKK